MQKIENKEIIVKENKIRIIKIQNKEYISLTDLARYANPEEPKIPIQTWMINKDVISYLGLWEGVNNLNLKGHEFTTFENLAGKNSFYMSPQKWIKEIIVPNLTEKQKKLVYKEETDVLNVALFGMTARQWKNKYPELASKGNIRDYTDLLHLIILNNLENINAEMIKLGMSQSDRLVKLNNSARRQLELLKTDKRIKKLEKLKKDVNKDLLLMNNKK